MQSISELRNRRVLLRIPGVAVCQVARLRRGRLSEIERGQATPTADEIARLSSALDHLEKARRKMAEVAERCGWPTPPL